MLGRAAKSRPSAGRPPARIRTAPVTILGVSGLLLGLLLPFIGKAFNIDDPLFLWAARHIQTHPADPYGFTVNWYGTEMPMASVTKNPPLVPYYIAVVASVFGWSEASLHLAFLLPTFAVAIGALLLAGRLCTRPLLAVLAGLLTPVFLVSSLTVMSDVPMLAFWVFAVHSWMVGLERHSHGVLAVAAVLIAASALAKYFGMTLIPLVLVYTVAKQRRIGWPLLYIVIPVGTLIWYQWATHQLYGRGLLFDAAEYATAMPNAFGRLSLAKAWVACAFTGGCVATVLCFARQLWSRRAIFLAGLLALAVTCVVASNTTWGAFPLPKDAAARWVLALQLGIWGTAGISLLALALLDLRDRRDAEAGLLFLWTIGTFLFAAFINWSTNGRSVLPMVIPAGILIARRIEGRTAARKETLAAVGIPLAAATLLAVAVTWSDYRLARAARQGAMTIHEKYRSHAGTLWFEGHWGFQYYMQGLGGRPIDVRDPRLTPGDLVAEPTVNSNLLALPSEWTAVREIIPVPSSAWLSTMDLRTGAGFYADAFGPLPFAFGTDGVEKFTIYEVHTP